MQKGLLTKQLEIESMDLHNTQLNERIRQLESINEELKANKEKVGFFYENTLFFYKKLEYPHSLKNFLDFSHF